MKFVIRQILAAFYLSTVSEKLRRVYSINDICNFYDSQNELLLKKAVIKIIFNSDDSAIIINN